MSKSAETKINRRKEWTWGFVGRTDHGTTPDSRQNGHGPHVVRDHGPGWSKPVHRRSRGGPVRSRHMKLPPLSGGAPATPEGSVVHTYRDHFFGPLLLKINYSDLETRSLKIISRVFRRAGRGCSAAGVDGPPRELGDRHAHPAPERLDPGSRSIETFPGSRRRRDALRPPGTRSCEARPPQIPETSP